MGIGFLTGVVSALFAAGGGPFFSIVMQWRYKRSIKEINGAALALLAGVASVNLSVRWLIEPKDIAFGIGIVALVFGLIGSQFGKWLETRCNTRQLAKGFAFLLIIAGLRMMKVCIFPAFPVPEMLVFPIAGVVGFIAGTASQLFGMGGGLVLVPVFALYGRLSANEALATSLFASVPMMFYGSNLYHREGRVKGDDIRQLLLPGLAGAAVGAFFSRQFIPDQILQTVFGTILIACAMKAFVEYLPQFKKGVATAVVESSPKRTKVLPNRPLRQNFF
ncbi:MAG: sulfite exporter TauE/SafE family protein [Candidatus Sungbacteria bacterium]|nr:sulfite exporter TauE/SafE family protein [Candidatus Sungbacteria bacterium]